MSQIVDSLKNDPIFIMSLSSKELFHSNFWAWLFERNAAYAKIFFPKLEAYDSVVREQGEKNHGKRDITLWNGGSAYVIENKFKSMPDREQLERYETGLASKFSEGVITGIEKPTFLEDESLGKWKFMAYDEIGQQIIKTAKDREAENSFERNLIEGYGNMLCNLCKCVNSVFEKSERRWLADYQEVAALRINDIVQKLKADAFSEYLKSAFGDGQNALESEIGDYKLTFSTGFESGNAVARIHYKLSDEALAAHPDALYEIGVELQGDEYRWAVIKKVTLSREKDRDRLFEEYQKGDRWFVAYDPKTAGKKIKGHDTALTIRYRRFAPERKTDPYTMLYQYWRIQTGEDSFEKLKTCILDDMQSAAKILHDMKK